MGRILRFSSGANLPITTEYIYKRVHLSRLKRIVNMLKFWLLLMLGSLFLSPAAAQSILPEMRIVVESTDGGDFGNIYIQHSALTNTQQNDLITGTPEGRFERMGLNWWQFSLAMLMLPVVAFLIYRFILYVGSEFAIRMKKRAQSEISQFQLLGHLAGQDDPVQFFNQLMKWYDAYRSRCQEPAHGLNQFVASSRDKELIEAYTRLNDLLFADRDRVKWSGASFYAALKRYRKKCLSRGHADSTINFPGINPS